MSPTAPHALNKRQFLAGSLGGTLVGTLGSLGTPAATAAAAATATPGQGSDRLRWRPPAIDGAMRARAWQAYVGQDFKLPALPGQALRLEGVQPRHSRATAAMPGLEMFDLVFVPAGPAQGLLPLQDSVHALHHAGSGQRLSLHLVPRTQGGGAVAHCSVLA